MRRKIKRFNSLKYKMDIRYQIEKTTAYRAPNKVNKIGKESNPRNVVKVVRSTYVISEQEAKRYWRQPYVISGAM